MATTRFAGKVVYYGGYPGSSGKPAAGRLRWRDGVLSFEPSRAEAISLRVERSRLRGVRRSEEGMTGARRIRLLIDVETDQKIPATLKFEMGGLWRKERKLVRWLELLQEVCRNNAADKTTAAAEEHHV